MHLKLLAKEQFKKQLTTGDLVGNKIADKNKLLKKTANEPHSNDVSNEIPQERQKIIDELRLI